MSVVVSRSNNSLSVFPTPFLAPGSIDGQDIKTGTVPLEALVAVWSDLISKIKGEGVTIDVTFDRTSHNLTVSRSDDSTTVYNIPIGGHSSAGITRAQAIASVFTQLVTDAPKYFSYDGTTLTVSIPRPTNIVLSELSAALQTALANANAWDAYTQTHTYDIVSGRSAGTTQDTGIDLPAGARTVTISASGLTGSAVIQVPPLLAKDNLAAGVDLLVTGTTGKSIPFTLESRQFYLGHNDRRLVVADGTISDSRTLTITIDGGHLKGFADARKDVKIESKDVGELEAVNYADGSVSKPALSKAVQDMLLSAAARAKLDSLSDALGRQLGKGTFTAVREPDDSYVADRRAGQTAKGSITGSDNLRRIALDDGDLDVYLTGTVDDNESYILEIGDKRVHLDDATVRVTTANTSQFSWVSQGTGPFAGWFTSSSVPWVLYEKNAVVPQPEKDGLVLLSLADPDGTGADFRYVEADALPVRKPFENFGPLQLGITLSSTGTDSVHAAAPVETTPLVSLDDYRNGQIALTLFIEYSVPGDSNASLEQGASSVHAHQRKRVVSTIIPVEKLKAAQAYVDNTNRGGVTDVFIIPAYTGSGGVTLSGHFRLDVVRKTSNSNLAFYSFWTARAGSLAGTITAELYVTIARGAQAS